MSNDQYRDAYGKETRDLVAEYRKKSIPEVMHRDDDIEKVLNFLDRNQSVLVLGPSSWKVKTSPKQLSLFNSGGGGG